MFGCSRSAELPGGFDSAGSQRIYAIELDGETAGVIHERRGLTSAGAPRMDTRMELMLPGSGIMLREERLQFAKLPPFGLEQRTRFTRTPAGIEHHEVATGRELGDPRLMEFDSTRALKSAPEGSTIEQRGLFAGDDGTRMRTSWQIQTRNAEGTYATGTREDGAEVALWIGPDGSPERYEIGSGFGLRRVSEAPVLPSEHGGVLLVPADRGLEDHRRVEGMTVRIEGPAAVLFRSGPGLEARATESGRILRVERLGADGLDPIAVAMLERLISEVRARIRYHAAAAPPTLDALLEDGRGDCYEFAALFHALAKAAGFEGRVVTGLAWAGNASQGFAPHAWNEVRVDGRWVSIDPTWDQLGADAARLRFPEDPALQLDLQFALKRSRLEILSVSPGQAASVALNEG